MLWLAGTVNRILFQRNVNPDVSAWRKCDESSGKSQEKLSINETYGSHLVRSKVRLSNWSIPCSQAYFVLVSNYKSMQLKCWWAISVQWDINIYVKVQFPPLRTKQEHVFQSLRMFCILSTGLSFLTLCSESELSGISGMRCVSYVFDGPQTTFIGEYKNMCNNAIPTSTQSQ